MSDNAPSPPRPRICLQTLGGLRVEAPGAALGPASVQQRRLTLLACIAAAGESGISRDQLMVLFWPESDEARARNALKQTLHTLRRDLGQPDLIVGAPHLRVNTERASVDVLEFRKALAERRWTDAITVFRGAFLDGVRSGGSADLDEWIEQQRADLGRGFQAALLGAAREAAESGKRDNRIRLLRRLAATEPLNSRFVRDLAGAIAEAGDLAGALAVAQEHEARLARELDVAPDADFQLFVESLRQRKPAIRFAPSAPMAARGPVSLPVPHSRWPRPLFAALAALLVFAVTVAAVRASKSAVRAPRLAVLPFHVQRGSSLEAASSGAIELITPILADVKGIRVLDAQRVRERISQLPAHTTAAAAATALDVDWYVAGSVAADSNMVSITASLFDRRDPDRPLASATEDRPRSSYLQGFAAVAAKLLTPLVGPGIRDRVLAAARGTSSPTALREFIAGELDFRESRYSSAVEAYRRATAADSHFALAFYRLSAALDWAGLSTQEQRTVAKRATALAGNLPPRDSLKLFGLLAWRRGDADEAERLYRQVAEIYPDDPDAWFQLGEVRFHDNEPRGRSMLEARVPFENAKRIDSTDHGVTAHLWRLAMVERNATRADSLWRHLPASVNQNERLERDLTWALFLRDSGAMRQAFRAMEGGGEGLLHTSAWRIAAHVGDLDAAERLLWIMTAPQRPLMTRATGHWNLALIMAARGQFGRAEAHVRAMAELIPHWSLQMQAFLDLLPFRAVPAEVLRQHAQALRASRDSIVDGPALFGQGDGTSRHAMLALYSLALGDTAGALAAVVDLRRTRGVDSANAATAADALFEIMRGAPCSLGAARRSGAQSTVWLFNRARDRYLCARAHERRGEVDEALRWYNSFERAELENLVFAAPAQLARARLLRQQGRAGEAELAQRRATELWRAADAP